MAEEDVPPDWRRGVPINLLPLVESVRDGFNDNRSRSALITQIYCDSALHPDQNGGFLDFSALQIGLDFIRESIPASSLRLIDEWIKSDTPSCTLKAYFILHSEMMTVAASNAFRHLFEIGRTHGEELETPLVDWVAQQVESLIGSATADIADWLKNCCDGCLNETHTGTSGLNDWEKWHAPRLTIMNPNFREPYEPARAWERESLKNSRTILKMYAQSFELHLRHGLKRWKGHAHEILAELRARHRIEQDREPGKSSTSTTHRTDKSKRRRGDGKRRSVIFGAIQAGLKGPKYCAKLDQRKLALPLAWKEQGCPETYTQAYRDARWKKRIQDEKCTYRERFDQTSPSEREAIIQGNNGTRRTRQ